MGATFTRFLAGIYRQVAAAAVKSRHAGEARAPRSGKAGSATRLAMALEPRYMFDGAGVATAAEAAHDSPPALARAIDQADSGADGASPDPNGSSASPVAVGEALAAVSGGGEPPTSSRREVVIIDSQVSAPGALIAGIDSGAEVHVLDASRDSVEQITEILAQRQNLDAVHIVSHGGEGFIELGGQTLSAGTLAGYREALGAWGAALSEQGDLLLYGCRVGADGDGPSFLAAVAEAAGADVAGSDDVTGRGGDWDLERSAGAIETAALSVPDYPDQLAVTGITPSAGALDVAAGDNIVLTFDSATTLTKDADFFVRGSLSGQIGGALTGNGTTTVTFDPTNNFKPGEVVTVEVTAAAGGPRIYRYTVAAASADLLFHDSGQTLSTQNTQVVALGDFDGDGDLDMVQGNPGNQNIKVWLNNGSGSFTDNGQTLTSLVTSSIALGDIDGDGDLDIVMGNLGQANKVWRNDGAGQFTDSGQSLGTHQTWTVALGDVDGDGDLDLVQGNRNQADKVWLNNGSGAFTDSGQTLGAHNTVSVVLGDVDGDGDLDLVQGTRSQTNRVWLNNGSGVFTDSGQTLGNHNTSLIALGDVDGDGDLDMIQGGVNQATRVWLNNGSGAFTDSGQTLGAHHNYSVALGDVDGDGDLDLVQGNRNQATKVWLNNGAGAFTDSGESLGAHNTYSVALGDVDGDGAIDVVQANYGEPTKVWLNTLNTAPTFTNLNGGATYVQYGGAVVIDSDVTVADTGMDAAGSHTGYTGSSITIARNGGANADDVFGATGVLGALTEGQSFTYNGIKVGAVTTNSAGTLTLTFNSRATGAIVDSILQKISYSNSSASPPASVTLDWTFNDGVLNSTGANQATVTITASGAPSNANPTLSNLNGGSVAWAGESATALLDSGSDAAVADTENGAGGWNNSVLTVQRIIGSTAAPLAADVFSFQANGAFSLSGGDLVDGNSAIFASLTNTGGVLTITFNGGATAALINAVVQNVQYQNDTPTGDTIIRFALTDGATGVANADVTVASDTIYVTSTSDTAVVDVTDGVGLREAVAITESDDTGAQTIKFASGLASGAVTLGSNLAVSENLGFDASNASGLTLTGSTVTVASGAVLTFASGSGSTLSIASKLTGSGGVAKSGAGTVTLNNAANDYSGATAITAGTLATLGGGGIGNTSAVTVASGVTLSLGAGETIGSLAGAGDVALATFTLTTGDTTTTEFSGVISGTGTLAKAGTGALTLSGTNTFTGGVSISGGTLELKGGAALADTPTITFTGGALLVSASETVGGISSSLGAGSISIASGVVLTAKPTIAVTFSGVISGAGGLTLDGSAALTLSAANTFTGALTIKGGGVTLTNASSIGGVTSIVFEGAGTLAIASVNVTLSASITLTSGGAIGAGSGRTLTLTGVISGAGDLTSSGPGTLVLSGANTFTGQLKINAGTTSISSVGNLGAATDMTINGGTLTIGNDMTIAKNIAIDSSGATISTVKAVTLSGVISGSGSFSVGGTGTGGGGVTLTGANTMTGAINVTSTTTNGTTLVLTSASSVGATSGVAVAATGNTVALQGGITLSGIPFSLRGTGAKINAVSVGALYSISGDNVINPGAGNATIGMLTASTINVAAGGSLKLGSNVTGSVGLTKAGAGALTLAGSNNTYSGATTISAGTLLLAGAITGTGSITVGSGATLGGAGSIAGGVSVVSGATLAPGVAGANGGVGKLTIGGNLSLLGTLAIDITGATGGGVDYDQIVATASVTLSSANPSTSALTLSSTYSIPGGQSFDLILKSGATGISNKMSFGGSTVNEGGSLNSNGSDFTLSYTGSSGNDLVLTATNARPAATNLNSDSVAWAGVGNGVILDASGNATLTDADLDAANSGAGDWSGASIAVARSSGAVSSDIFDFDLTGAGFTVSGNELQSGGGAFATFTNSGGALAISFTSSGTTATSALAQEVLRRITYRNDTPTGDVVIRFTVSDGAASTTADVTVASDTIVITNATDTSTIDLSDGVSFSEAVALAAADATGTQILMLASSLAGQSVSISSNPTLGESLTLDADSASGATLSDGTLTIGSGFTLTVTTGTGDTFAITGVVAGDGALTKTGTGTLTLTGENTYTGGTTVSAGTLTLNNGSYNALADSGAVMVDSGATLGLSTVETVGSLAGAGSVTLAVNTLTIGGADTSTSFDGVISGAGGLTKSGSGTQTLTGINTYTGATTVSAGGLTLNNASGAALSNSSKVTLSGGTLNLASASETIGELSGSSSSTLAIGGNALTITQSNSSTYSGAITGAASGNLTFSGSGASRSLTLAGVSNSSGFAGSTTVTGGQLLVTSDSNLGSGAVTLNGGALRVEAAITIDNAITLGAGNGTISVAPTYAVTLSGEISGSGNLTKAAAGSLILSHDNSSFSGNVQINAGLVTISHANALGNTAGGATVASGAALSLSGDISLAENLTLSGAGISSGGALISASGSNTVSGTVTLAADTTVTATSNLTLSGVIRENGGAFALTKGGVGALTLSGTNSYTGATTVSAGTLALSGGAAVADASEVTLVGAATLVVGASETIGGLTGVSGNTVTLNNNATLTVSQTTNTTFAGVIASGTSSTGGLTKSGAGELTLSGANTYTGATTVSGGTLSIDGGSSIADTSAVTVSAGATLWFYGNVSETIGSLAGAGAVSLNNGALTIGGDNASTTFSGVIEESQVGSIIKTGAGTLTLSGANTYSGSTTISAGTLYVTGALGATGRVSVASGATLGGTGSIFAASSGNMLTVNDGATLAPGAAGVNNGIGRLTVNGNVRLSGGLEIELASAGGVGGTDYDQVAANGVVQLNGGPLTVSRVNGFTGTNNTLRIIDNDSTDAIAGSAGAFATYAEGATFSSNGSNYVISYVGGSGNDVTLTDNSPPTFTSTAATTANEDIAYTYAVTASDTGGDTVTVTATTLPSWLAFSNGVLSGTPTKDHIGSHSVVLSASDGDGGGATQTFTITVAFVNDAPAIAATPGGSATEDSGYSYTIATTDEEGEAVTVTATALPSWLTFSNGVLSGAPSQSDVGTHTVVLTAADASGGRSTQTFAITVAAVNDAPVFTSSAPTSVNEDAAYVYALSATDEEGQSITYAATALPSWLTFSNGVLSGTPGQADVGSHAVALTATDASGAKTTQTFTITVTEVNDAPVFASTAATSVNEKSTYSYAPTATDEEVGALTLTATTLPSWLTFLNGVLSGTPGQADVGSHAVALTATDALGAKTTQTFTITVTGVNDAPVFASTAATSVNEKSTYSYAPTATDEEGQAVSYTATALPSWMTFANGVLSGTPSQADVGSHAVTLVATDALGAKTTQSFTVTVNDVNDAPAFTSGQPGNATAGLAYGFALSASDPDGGKLSFGATGLPSWLTLTDNGDGTASLSGAPGSGDVGAVSVTVRVVDAGGASSTQVLNFTVAAAEGSSETTATLNITQTTTTTTATTSTTSSSTLTGSGTSSTTTTSSGTGTNAGTGSTTVAITATGGGTGGTSAPGGNDAGASSPATVRVGNVDGNTSSATGIQQTQGLTSTATSGDASASADGSTLVRNAARGDSAATSSFYGASTILSLSNLNGGSSTGGSSGFGAGASGGFGGSGPGSGFGASAGGLGGGLGSGLGGGGFSGGATAGANASGGISAGGASVGGVPSSGAGGTGTAGSGASSSGGAAQGQTGAQGRVGNDGQGQNQGQGGPRNAATPGAPSPGTSPQGTAPQTGAQPAPQGNAPPATGDGQPTPQSGGQPTPQSGGQPTPQSGGEPAAATPPGPQTGLDGLFRGQWTAQAQRSAAAPLPGHGVSEQLTYMQSAFDRQAARLEAAAAALRNAA